MTMKKLLIILSIPFILQSCYVSKYNDLKRNYETLKKKSSDENSKLAKVKRTYNQKFDSVQNLKKENVSYIINLVKADSIADSISRYIQSRKNLDFSADIKQKSKTAKDIKSMKDKEKDLFYYLNLARNKPSLYAELYLNPSMGKSNRNSIIADPFNTDTSTIQYYSYYVKSLYLEMKKMAPAGILTFNEKCRESAECHAVTTGKLGLITHNRTPDCVSYFSGECCYYGSDDPENIITELLIDSGIVSLGHRRICLSSGYSSLGVAIRDHKTFRKNAVLDFK
jgi:hypothetical protein